jgi:replicative DNA helicase
MSSETVSFIPPQKGAPVRQDTERAILGAIILDNRSPNECLLQTINYPVTVEDFSLDAHRRIYRAILDLDSDEKPIDYNTLTDVLSSKGELESVGGNAYVTDLGSSQIRLKNVESYCGILTTASSQRQLILANATAIHRNGGSIRTGRSGRDNCHTAGQHRHYYQPRTIPQLCSRLNDRPGIVPQTD